MSQVTWEASGRGPVDLSLQDAHQLAVLGGFVFTDDATVPLNKRANLQSRFSQSFSHLQGSLEH